MRLRLFALLSFACGPQTADGPTAIVDPARATHFFDLPFPSDALRAGDRVDLSGFPSAEGLLGAVVEAWVDRAQAATRGFAATGPAVFRFEGPLDVPTTLPGLPTDPVVLVDVETGALLPLELRFVGDPGDDPFLAPNTLLLAPALGVAPRSGATLAAVVLRPTASPAPGWSPPDGVLDALGRAGVRAAPAVATVFTTQDAVGEVRALTADVDRVMATLTPVVALRRVTSLRYRPGTTPSGNAATLAEVTYEDGGADVTFLRSSDLDLTVDLGAGWPMAVFEARAPVPYYTRFEDQPYMSPGAAHLLDTGRTSGWIDVADGAVLTGHDVDEVRVVLSLPKGADGEVLPDVPLVVWDHGTAGHAYNHVQRRALEDDGRRINTILADAGWGVLGHDLPMYGQRFPLMDAGYTDGSLGFFNIVNLPAFRDNQRQAGLEGHALRRWAIDHLAPAVPTGLDTTRFRRLGHSLGTVAAHVGLAGAPDAWEAGFVSGSASHLALSFLETGLADAGGGLFDTLTALFGVEVDPAEGIGVVIAAGLGIEDPEARARIDRLHPVVGLFTWITEPSDPAVLAGGETLPVTVLMGEGDLQIPNRGTEALARNLPDGELVRCVFEAEGDPHYCLYRDEEGFAALEDWLR